MPVTAKLRVDWKGKAMLDKVRRAEKAALQDVGKEVADAARPNVPRDTGRAQGAIGSTDAEEKPGGGYRVLVGETEEVVPYLIHLELAGNPLRNALDAKKGGLAGKVKSELAKIR